MREPAATFEDNLAREIIHSERMRMAILASRIEQLNKEFGSQILASREVLEGAGGIPAEAMPLGPVRVKGREQPIELFRLA